MTQPDSTEYLIHTLKVSLDNLRVQMRSERERLIQNADIHWHRTPTPNCDKPGCAGLDPVQATLDVMIEEQLSIFREFPPKLFSRE